MPILLKAHVGLDGWATLKFPYNDEARERLKEFPGVYCRRDAAGKFVAWRAPFHLIPTICRDSFFKVDLSWAEPEPVTVPESIASRLKPYQLEGANRILASPGYMITFEPRVGKTPTAIAALCALFASGKVDLCVLLLPNLVIDVWERELLKWAELELTVLRTFEPLLVHEVAEIHAKPFPVVACSYEILSHRENCIARLIDGRRYAVIADEAQLAKNPKSGRARVMARLARGTPIIRASEDGPDLNDVADGDPVARVLLTGTPMRNRPKDLLCLFDFALPGSMGWGPEFKNSDGQYAIGLSAYSDRYCDGHVDDAGHYDSSGKSNEAELAERLAAISYRVTRREAAPWLPPSDRRFIRCDVAEAELKRYRELEQAYAPHVMQALSDTDPSQEDREMLKQLSNETARTKTPAAVRRAMEHMDRGVKVVVKAYHHEPAETFYAAYRAGQYLEEGRSPGEFPAFFAGGSATEATRRQAIEQWKAVDGPAVLVINLLSSGVGIDLSDAEVSIALEIAWVPADHLQCEDRQIKVHGEERTTSPLHEILFVRGTVDEAMASTLLEKIKAAEEIVGDQGEAKKLARELHSSGMVGSTSLGLLNTDKETVKAALQSLRDRLLRGPSAVTDKTVLAAEVASLDEGEDDDD